MTQLNFNLKLFKISILASFPTHDFQAFENEWVEVEVKQPIDYPKNIDFLMDNLSLPESLQHGNKREG